MAIFGFKKRKDEKLDQAAESTKAVAKSVKTSRTPRTASSSIVSKARLQKTPISSPAIPKGIFSGEAGAIIRPRVTEKSGLLSQSNIYTFEVTKDSNKAGVAKAIKALYKVVPVKVAIINTPIRNVFVKGRKGTVAGMKKAVVTIRKGEKIDFV